MEAGIGVRQRRWPYLTRRVVMFVVGGGAIAFVHALTLSSDQVLQIGGGQGVFWKQSPAIVASLALAIGGLILCSGLAEHGVVERTRFVRGLVIFVVGAVVALANMHFPDSSLGVNSSAGGSSSFSDADAYAFGYVAGNVNSDGMNGRCQDIADTLIGGNEMKETQRLSLMVGCMDGGQGKMPTFPTEVQALRASLAK